MPNHCDQSVYIHGPRDLVQELYWALELKEPRFCDVVAPMPLHQAGNSNDWCIENWGTKWDVAEVEIGDSGLERSDEEYPIPVAWFSFKCWTAWAPPVPVWDKLHAMGIEVQADYTDEGGMFEGKYAHGVGSRWIPESDMLIL